MKPNQIFAAMPPEQCEAVLDAIEKEARDAYKQIVAAAAVAQRFRPQFLMKMAPKKRAGAVRRALTRVGTAQLGEELLAVYFLQCRTTLLAEWLDLVGLEHEDGVLTQESVPQPDEKTLAGHVETFRKGEGEADRLLLLRTFAAQAAIEWPALDALVAETDAEGGAASA